MCHWKHYLMMGNSTPFIMFNVLQFIYIHNKPKFLLYFLFTPYLSVLFDCNCCSYKTVGILPHNINSHIFAFHLPFSRWPSLVSLLSPIQGKYLPSSSSGFHGNHVLSHSLAARRPLLFLPPSPRKRNGKYTELNTQLIEMKNYLLFQRIMCTPLGCYRTVPCEDATLFLASTNFKLSAAWATSSCTPFCSNRELSFTTNHLYTEQRVTCLSEREWMHMVRYF